MSAKSRERKLCDSSHAILSSLLRTIRNELLYSSSIQSFTAANGCANTARMSDRRVGTIAENSSSQGPAEESGKPSPTTSKRPPETKMCGHAANARHVAHGSSGKLSHSSVQRRNDSQKRVLQAELC